MCLDILGVNMNRNKMVTLYDLKKQVLAFSWTIIQLMSLSLQRQKNGKDSIAVEVQKDNVWLRGY